MWPQTNNSTNMEKTMTSLELVKQLYGKELTKDGFNAECPCDSLLSAYGFNCTKQTGNVKFYNLSNEETGIRRNFLVNTFRNDWWTPSDGSGKATDLVGYLGMEAVTDKEGSFIHLTRLFDYYREILKLSDHFTYEKKALPGSMLIGTKTGIVSRQMEAILSLNGISNRTALENGIREMRIHLPQEPFEASLPALPNDEGGLAAFSGDTLYSYSHTGISTFGCSRSTLIYNIFDNMMDFLAFKELASRKGQKQPSIIGDIVMNGTQNLDKAIKFILDDDHYARFNCYLPQTTEGRAVTWLLHSETGQKLVEDNSKLFSPYCSLSGMARPRIPDSTLNLLKNFEG